MNRCHTNISKKIVVLALTAGITVCGAAWTQTTHARNNRIVENLRHRGGLFDIIELKMTSFVTR